MIAETDTLSKVADLWAAGESIHSLQEQRWVLNKKLCTSQHTTARKLGQSALFVPKIESFHSRKQADFVATFGGEDPISLKRTINSSQAGAKIMETVLNYYVTDSGIDWDGVVLNTAHDALTYNFAPWVIDWDRGVEIVESEAVELQEDGTTRTSKVKQEVETHSHPTLESIPPEDIRIDPSVGWNEVGLARFGIIRRYRDKAYADRMAASGDWPKLDDSHFGVGFRGGNNLAQQRSQLNHSMFGLDVDIDNGLLEVWYCYYYEEVDGKLAPVVAVTLRDELVLEEPSAIEFDIGNADGTDPWPFGVARVYVEPHELFSRAMPERLESLQIETNAIRNQRRDNVALVLNREKFMTPEAGVDPAVLSRSFAGKVTTVKSKGSVWWDTPPDVTSSSYTEENVSVNDMEALVAESKQRLGATATSGTTATETKISSANSSQAMGLDMTVFAMTGPRRWVEKLIRMVRLAADPTIFEAAAEFAAIVSPDAYSEAMTGDFRIKVGTGTHQSMKDLAISNASNMAAVLQAVYGPAAQYNPIMKPMLEENGFNPDDILPPPQGQPAQQQQDMGGVMGQNNLTIQPNVQMTGGAFGGGVQQ